MTEITVNLNVHEMGIILTSLRNLEPIDEIYISREYGSVNALYEKINCIWEKMDKSEIQLKYDVVPSF
jgi:hypothetical protein